MLLRRRSLSPSVVQTMSRDLTQHLQTNDFMIDAKTLAGYDAVRNELSLSEFLTGCIRQGKEIFLPKFDDSVQNYQYASIKSFENDLKKGKFGILEPRNFNLTVPICLDVILIPCVAVSKQGHRLGHGSGYFDRLVSTVSGVKVAVVYDFQILEGVPVEAHDCQCDFIATPTQFFSIK